MLIYFKGHSHCASKGKAKNAVALLGTAQVQRATVMEVQFNENSRQFARTQGIFVFVSGIKVIIVALRRVSLVQKEEVER